MENLLVHTDHVLVFGAEYEIGVGVGRRKPGEILLLFLVVRGVLLRGQLLQFFLATLALLDHDRFLLIKAHLFSDQNVD